MYDHKAIETKWLRRWEADPARAKDNAPNKTYLLIEFPFPSGDGLHVGHVRGYTALDIVARKRRRQGENVLYPIGWDAFGLPTENYAIKVGRNPADVTKENTDIFRRQMKQLGLSFDWSREVNTTDPKFYKWTQWIFLKLYEHGLAYKASVPINWCPKDKIGLANEEVVDGKCERCGTPVEKREREQWMLAITKYAQRLYDDLDTVDYIERAKVGQRNWIGPSEGAEITFKLTANSKPRQGRGTQLTATVFTTRPDTLFGATYMVLAPEHPVVAKLIDTLTNKDEVSAYIEEARKKDEIARTDATKEKTGVLLEGVTATNPANNKAIPVFIADYVLASYGTGAIMAVPAHDERDHEFAQKFDLPIKTVIAGEPEEGEACYTGEGDIVDSGDFNGIPSTEAKKKITDFVKGNWTTKYKLRDWVFSRQRYWGEPIPMVHCEQCGWVPVPEDQLPVELPHVEHYEPTETGDSPLAGIDEWVNTTCPACNGAATRETDVMPNWAGSSWYYLRYCDPHNDAALADTEKMKYWLPVDWYNGGMEHTTLHLLYSRFWHKFLYDIKAVPTPEPYAKRTSHGLVLIEGGEKMSKSKGNVINPDDIVERFGADALRVYEMFMGPFDQAIAWSTDGLAGVRRFLERVVKLSSKANSSQLIANSLEILMHQTIKKVSKDIEDFHLNTAVSQLMIFANDLEKEETVSRHAYETLVVLLAPFAPFIAEELWEALGNEGSVHKAPWPSFDPNKLVGSEVTIAVQVNGKVRGTVSCAPGTPEATVLALARADKKVSSWTERGDIDKVFYVPDRLINIVVKGA